jgi:hypothetical protein
MHKATCRVRQVRVVQAVALAVAAAAVLAPGAGASGPTGRIETPGGVVHTWSNYRTAGGKAGPLLASHHSVTVRCRVRGFKVADGDRWWYRIASTPWDGRYYASADAFYNNGHKSGSLVGTPLFDPNVPLC